MLGLFIALIATNCAIFGRAESYASKHGVLPALADTMAMGLGFTWVLVVGAMREILGNGTLFCHASLLLGQHFAWLEMLVIPNFSGILLSILPHPGAFMALGFLLAIKRVIGRRRDARAPSPSAPLVVLQN